MLPKPQVLSFLSNISEPKLAAQEPVIEKEPEPAEFELTDDFLLAVARERFTHFPQIF